MTFCHKVCILNLELPERQASQRINIGRRTIILIGLDGKAEIFSVKSMDKFHP